MHDQQEGKGDFRVVGIDGGDLISEALEKLRKIAENCGKLISFFWDLEKIAVKSTPLCTVPEVKGIFFTSPKRGVSNFFFNKNYIFLGHK